MGLLERWDGRNQRIAQEHNEVTWEEFSDQPRGPSWLKRYFQARVVGTVVGCFLGLFALVAWAIESAFL